ARRPLLARRQGPRSDACGSRQSDEPGLPRALLLPDGDRLAALRCSLRPLLRPQPGPSALDPELAMAAPIAAPARPHGVPVLPRAGRGRRKAAGAHSHCWSERDAARSLRHPVGSVAMGRIAPAAAAAALVLAAAACGERSEPTGSTVPLYPV